MKKIILALCVLLLSAGNVLAWTEISDDIFVTIFNMVQPRTIRIVVTDDGIPIEGELVSLTRMYRQYCNIEEGQPYAPLEGSISYDVTDCSGTADFYRTWGHFQGDVRDQEDDIGAGDPYKIYIMDFNF